jgi:hypothetical protein
MSAIARRGFLKGVMAGALVGAPAIAGLPAAAAPRPPRFLTSHEAQTLAAVGEALVPGSAKAGLVAYVDAQLAGPAERSMLMGKYVGVTPPYGAFYQRMLAAFDALAQRTHERPWARLSTAETRALITRVAAGDVADWTAAPAAFCCFVLRADAVDVTYGTPQGFEALGIPYRAHIMPSTAWAG